MDYFLLTYLNRSGSTYLSNLLSKYNEILVCLEAEILVKDILEKKEFIRIDENFLDKLKNDIKFKHWHLDLKILDFEDCENNIDIFLKILDAYRMQNKPHASVILFKALELLGIYDQLQQMDIENSQIHFIALIRDPRAIFHSQKTTYSELKSSNFSSNPLIIAYQWNKYVKTCKKYLSNDDFHLLHYEQIILHSRAFLKDLFEKVGLSINHKIQSGRGDLSKRIPIDQKSLHKKIDDEPDAERISTWMNHLSPSEVTLIETVNAYEMNELGYKLVIPTPNIYWFLFLKLYYKLLIFFGLSKYF